jgi:molybdate transport repressor ModE-like protein
MRKLQPAITWTFADRAGPSLARELVPLLAGIAAGGSLAAAARGLGLSYRGAWGVLEAAERSTGATFAVLERGRGSRLSPLGERLVAADAAAAQLLVTNAGALRVSLRQTHPAPAAAHTLRVAASHDMALAALRAQWRTHAFPQALAGADPAARKSTPGEGTLRHRGQAAALRQSPARLGHALAAR